MLYTRIMAAAIILLPVGTSFAQPQQKLDINEATVFLKGAELISNAKVALTKGENEIVFTNVAGDINSQSITVAATNGVVVESATFQNNYLVSDNLSPIAKILKDSIEIVKEQKQAITNHISVINMEISILDSNKTVSGANSGLSVAELQRMLDLVDKKMESYLDQRSKQKKIAAKLEERITLLTKQLAEEQKKQFQPGGQLLVKFYAKDATSSAITVDYVVTNAGWSPTYDVYADDINSPIKLYYKANVYQNSGVKWNNVRLSLSTGNPNEGVNAPDMSPEYISFFAHSHVDYDLAAAPAGVYKERKAVALNSAGAQSEDKDGVVAGVQVQSSINDYVTVDNAGVNTTFDIDLPYTIPSDGKQHMVAVKKYDLPATYRYFAVPKLDNDVFLQAQITNWEDLNLLPAQTNIFYEGSYVGQGFIDTHNTKDTMTISLGRDKKIVVKREQDKKLRSVKTIGTNIRETFGYSISVRNTRKTSIDLTLLDQVPISNDKDIVIEDRSTEGANYNETTGEVKWTLNLAPNETKKLSLSYTIKYPKGKTLNQ